MIRNVVIWLALLLLLPAPAGAQQPRVQEPEQPRPWAVYFSSDGGGAQAVVEALGRARKTARVHVMTLTSPPITKALMDAHQRGVRVEVIVDGKLPKGRYSAAAALAQAGIAVLNDRLHTTGGNNAMVLDAAVVVTGTFTFTPAGDGQSAEHLMVIHDPTLAARFGEHWEVHAAHAVRAGAP